MELQLATYDAVSHRDGQDFVAILHAYTPALGMAVAFRHSASEALGGIPASVSNVWPRLSCGDYLVTLEYAEPTKFHDVFIKHIEAFMSDLEPVFAA